MLCREQWKIIHSLVFQKRDNCAILATGTDALSLYIYTVISHSLTEGGSCTCTVGLYIKFILIFHNSVILTNVYTYIPIVLGCYFI